MDASALRLFDHVYAVYRPPERESRPEYAKYAGQRGLFQVVGVISKDDRTGGTGELAMMPRQLRGATRFPFHRCPVSHLAELRYAPPAECAWTY